MSSSDPTRVRCPRCGLGLAVGWKWGLCPGCLARTGFEGMAPAAEEKGMEDGVEDSGTQGGALPRSFGRYVLLAELGRGGQGVVFEAQERGLDRRVAVKLLRGPAWAGPEAVARFEVEAQAAAAVRHSNLVAVHEVGAWDGQPYYAMDHIAGRDLAAVMADGPVSPRQAAEWLRTIARAVQAAHDQGVLHRDLKPSNILVDEAGTPFVTDFGLAKRWAETAPLTMTLSHQVLGSPHYMPPEQVSSRGGRMGPAADVYGLGAILYHQPTYEKAKAAGGRAMELPVAHRPRVVPLPWGAKTGQSVPGTGWFAVDAADGGLRFYHPDTFEEVHRLEGPLSLARLVFSPEGQPFGRRSHRVGHHSGVGRAVAAG